MDELFDERKLEVSKYAKRIGIQNKIKHLPPFKKKEQGKLTNLETAWNTGIIYSDGDLIFFGTDFTWFGPTLLGRYATLEKAHLDAKTAFVGSIMQSESPKITDETGKITIYEKPIDELKALETLPKRFDSRWNNMLGIIKYSFSTSNNDLTYSPAPLGLFGSSCVSLDGCLEVNGFDEAYDYGGHGFDDTDFCFRLFFAGYAFFIDPANTSLHITHDSNIMPKSGDNRNREYFVEMLRKNQAPHNYFAQNPYDIRKLHRKRLRGEPLW